KANRYSIYSTSSTLLNFSRKKPAKIGQAVEVAQDLSIEILVILYQGGDTALRPATSSPGEIERSRSKRATGNYPILEFHLFAFLDLVNYRGHTVDHSTGGNF